MGAPKKDIMKKGAFFELNPFYMDIQINIGDLEIFGTTEITPQVDTNLVLFLRQ